MTKTLHHWSVVFLTVSLFAPAAHAADEAATDKPRVVVLCPECGMVFNIRRIEKPVAPERNLMPNLAQTMNNEARTVPLLSIGAGGAQRVPREPATRTSWETTVRYDNGQFGFVMHDMEPEFKVGDRVRHIENSLEVLPQSPR